MTSVAIYDPVTDQNLSVPVKSLRQRIAHGSFWALTGSVLSQGMTFLAILVCARLLGKEGFGELGIVRSTVSMLGIFGGMGLGLTATKYVAEYRHSDPERAGRIIGLVLMTALFAGLAMSALLATMAPVVAERILAARKLTIPLAIGSILLFMYTFDGAQKGTLAGFEEYRTIAKINAVVGLATFPVIAVGVYYGGLDGALAGLVIVAALTMVCNNAAIRRTCSSFNLPLTRRGLGREKGVLIGFGLPTFLANVMGLPTLWVGNALLIHQPSGYAQMGIIAATDQVRQMALFVPLSTMQCLLPILSMELNKKVDRPGAQKLHAVNSYGAILCTTSVVAVLLYFVGPLLMLYGNDFASGRIPMIVVLSTLPIATYRDGVHRLLQARGLPWYSFMLYAVWACIFIVSAVFMVRYGATGLTLAYFLSYFLGTVLLIPLVFARLRLERHLSQEITVIGSLTLALVPGILTQTLEMHLWMKFGLFIITAGFLAGAVWRVRSLVVTADSSEAPVQRERPQANHGK